MEPIKADFLLVKVDENTWDVVIFGEESVLKAFEQVYNAHYISESVFDKKPIAIIPDFPKKDYAEAWKQYWVASFQEPEKACKSCPTVNQLFNFIESARKKIVGNE